MAVVAKCGKGETSMSSLPLGRRISVEGTANDEEEQYALNSSL